MTRVNAGIPPRELHRAHLVAELREITMVTSSLSRSLKTRTVKDIMKGIPKQFSLNRGHVSWFYDKHGYLLKRFFLLCDEMERRGYKPDRSRHKYILGLDEIWYGDWSPTETDNNIVRARIAERISQKPHLYTDIIPE